MTKYHSKFIFTLLYLISLHFLIIQTHSQPPPPPQPPITTNATAPVPASTVCQSTQYPGYCKNVLPSGNKTANIYDYGRYSLRRSISQATNFLKLVNQYLSNSQKLNLTPSAIGALRDCQFLGQLNVDFLTTSFQSITSIPNKTLSITSAQNVQTFLSGILTNQQTCVDGLNSAQTTWSIQSGLNPQSLNNTRLFSVALTLFTKAWVPRTRRRNNSTHFHSPGRKRSPFQDGTIPPVKMSGRARTMFKARVQNRILLDNSYNNADDDDDVMISDIVIVSLDGSGNYTTVKDAVTSAPSNMDGTSGYYLIYVTAGIYEENVSIDKNKKYIMMIGDGINQTIITGNRSVFDNFTTFNSATLAVVGTGFVGINITIQNTAGAIKHQAVALRNGADLSTFYSCSFEAYQDTLYVHSLRQFYRECDIYGTVDFIFGNANAVFQNCNLYPRLPMIGQFNAITAQGRTDRDQNTGISIQNCTIRAADDLASSNMSIKTYLGRPWKQYSRTVYMDSFISDVVDPSGWRDWNGTFALDTLYYGEFNNNGPGSNTDRRVNWAGYHIMNGTDAANFTVANFLFGDIWLPQTGVPFFTGVL
ncbi:hypothetical protein RND81_04G088800 [Saponaria officinalis]|uniref:Pectinesterase n=1 Tax=Saponaria officinalis TaxID=3572 RepID=A0AAW1LJG2_SAPOF